MNEDQTPVASDDHNEITLYKISLCLTLATCLNLNFYNS